MTKDIEFYSKDEIIKRPVKNWKWWLFLPVVIVIGLIGFILLLFQKFLWWLGQKLDRLSNWFGNIQYPENLDKIQNWVYKDV